MNDIFKQNGSSCSPSHSMKEQSNNFNNIKWCIKNLTEKNTIKKVSSPKKDFSENRNGASKKSQVQYENNFRQQSQQLYQKLYPELSSKLGLTKSPSNNSDKTLKCVKKCNRSKSAIVSDNQEKKTDTTAMCIVNARNHFGFDKIKNNYDNTGGERLKEFMVVNHCEKKEIRPMPHLQGNSSQMKSNNFSIDPPNIQIKIKQEPGVHNSEKNSTNLNISEECQNRLLSSFTEKYSNKTNIIKVYPYTSSKPKVYTLPPLRVNSALKDAYAYNADLFPLGKSL